MNEAITNKPAVKEFNGLLIEAKIPRPTQDLIAMEAPLQILINNESYSITMRTPGHDHYLAIGLLFSEKLIHLSHSYKFHESLKDKDGFSSHINIVSEEIHLPENDRRLISNSSCGVCGKQKISDLLQIEEAITHSKLFDLNLLPSMLRKFEEQQILFQKTGGTHAAAAMTIEGQLIIQFEDVGRHNAVDKTIGYLIEENILSQAKILMISGRVSYEILMKAYIAKIPFITAVSAPSSLAIELATQMGITLIGFCRDNRKTVYTNIENVKF